MIKNLKVKGFALKLSCIWGKTSLSEKKKQTNRKYVPKMERKGMIDGRPVRDYPGERVTWTMVTAVEAVRRGRILDIFWRVSQQDFFIDQAVAAPAA